MYARFIICILFGVTMVSAGPAGEPTVVPRPAHVVDTTGQFTLGENAFVHAPMDEAEFILSALAEAAGFRLQRAPADATCAIQFLSNDLIPAGTRKPAGEGYRLIVLPETVLVHAETRAGRLNALQTLSHLLRTAAHAKGRITMPCLEIDDAPRFGWRGYMLDESRHFSGVDAVKRLLDAMAYYKLNRLHWHLTDSPGWRIEIKGYPKLTTVGGRGSETDRSPDAPVQFYTQDQVRDIVAYARTRGIVVVPEIDMPGHADAAVLAYPELDGGGFLQKGNTNKWPRFTFNPASPEVLRFLDTVLKEVAALFPDAGVLHFGGDEVHFGWQKWTRLPDVQELMRREKLKELADVEAWFNRRMAATIQDLGLKTGGWDEIAAKGLPADRTVIFWWRHDKPQILRSALDAGYPVVLTPRRPCYFDFVQHESHQVGRRWGGFNPLPDVYAFPDGLNLSAADERQILGIQACLWTETTVSQSRRDFLTWPRLIALAEAAWTPTARKDFASFEARLPAQFDYLRARGIGFYDPVAQSPEVTDQQGGKPKAHLD